MSWSVKYHFLSQTQRQSAVKENDMIHKPTRCKYTTLQQICKLIPPGLVDKIAHTVGVDKKARTFQPWSHVVAREPGACSMQTRSDSRSDPELHFGSVKEKRSE